MIMTKSHDVHVALHGTVFLNKTE